MKVNRVTAAVSGISVAGMAVFAGFGMTHQHAPASHHAASAVSGQPHRGGNTLAARPVAMAELAERTAHVPVRAPTTPRPATSADPALAWLESPGGQAQVTLNDDVDTLAAALAIEDSSPTVANHLVFEADGRTVRAEAQRILSRPALLPTVGKAAYEHMLNDYVVVANLLQPGPDYGTTAQDGDAWNVAMNASNIVVS